MPKPPKPTIDDLPPRGRPVTAEDRELPFLQSPALNELEAQAKREQPSQLALFTETPAGTLSTLPSGLTPLTAESPLNLARAWYRTHLEQQRRPANTIDSYSYDLIKFEDQIGSKPLRDVSRADVARFLGEASNKATRKRRLTTLRRFFTYVVEELKAIDHDPTEGFFPHVIALKTPLPLFQHEQEALLDAARGDEAWSEIAIRLMMSFGLSRGELLALRREHIDSSDPEEPVVYVMPEAPKKRNQERKIGGDAVFATLYSTFLDATDPVDLLFPVGFQAVNGMVERVAKRAEITHPVTPVTLRHSFAVNRAKAGATEEDLIYLLGLADDPRNRESVRRYLKLADPPL
jgi:integrase/recombinase XerD